MKVLIIVVLIISLTTLSSGISFRKAAEIPRGAIDWKRAIGFDTDQDGKQNLVFATNTAPFQIQFWEHIDFDRYFLEDTAQWIPLYDIGFLDTDSLVNMVGLRCGTPYPLYVYESPTQYSNPTNIVWQDSGFSNISGGNITDLDQDGLNEILFKYTDPYTFVWRTSVYENTGDNQYSLVWEDTVNHSAYFVDGDFDLDARIEFITGLPGSPGGGAVLVWECVGDNDYQLVFSGTLLEGDNIYDVFAANDMDGNGKPEFLFTSVLFLPRTVHLFLYETIGDNNYDYFLIDSVSGIMGSMWGQLSACGDVDADGKEEIVWSTFNQWGWGMGSNLCILYSTHYFLT